MKIGVIGAGAVGVGVCNYLLTLGSVSELVLLDQNLEGKSSIFVTQRR